MKRTRCVVVGLGRIGLDLLDKLSHDLDVVCIDAAQDAAERAREIRGDRVRVVTGDGTSRLVLEDAGVAEADLVAITTTTERTTVEVARVLHDHFAVPRVLAVGITVPGTRELEALGVEVEQVFPLCANALRNRIEQRSRTAHGIGLGREEILEVEVHARSRLTQKPLGRLTPRNWRVGIVYRDGKIVVPRGETRLCGGDRVVLLGQPAVLRTVVEILTLNFERFPLEYGASLTAYLTGGEGAEFFGELAYLRDVFPLQRAGVLLSPSAQRDRKRLEALWSAVGFASELRVESAPGPALEAVLSRVEEDAAWRGLLVLARSALAGRRGVLGARHKRLLRGLCEKAVSPVLLAAGSFPYGSVAVPGVSGVDLEHVLEAVFEMGPVLRQESSVLLVRPSPHLSTEADEAAFEALRTTVTDLSLVYRSSLKPVVLDGNPVTAVTAALSAHALLVLDTGGWKRQGAVRDLLDPDVPWHLVRRSPVSTLVVPPEEEAL